MMSLQLVLSQCADLLERKTCKVHQESIMDFLPLSDILFLALKDGSSVLKISIIV